MDVYRNDINTQWEVLIQWPQLPRAGQANIVYLLEDQTCNFYKITKFSLRRRRNVIQIEVTRQFSVNKLIEHGLLLIAPKVHQRYDISL